MIKTALRKLNKKQWVYIVLYGGGVLLLAAAAWLWCFRVQTNPERVFSGMLEQSLSTSAVTTQTTDTNESGTASQIMQYSLGADNRARSLTTVKQNDAHVVTEIIATPDADYTQYAFVETAQKNDKGEQMDVSSIVGVWAKTPSDGTEHVLFSQALLGLGVPLGGLPVPMAPLAPEQRKKLLEQIDNWEVYDVDYTDVKKQTVNGRLQYTYNVRMQVILYASLMKQFAQALGLHDFDQLDPNNYNEAPPVEMRMTIDVRSRHLAGVEVVGQSGTYKQTFSAYDIPITAPLPGKTITTSELQQRLRDL